MHRQRKEQGEQTRQAIIEVTTRLFADKGYAGTSLDLVAKAAKTSKSSIFWHFDNKEDLLFTVVDRAMTEWEVRASAEILAQSTPALRLLKLIDLYRDLARDRPDTLRLLLGLLLETSDSNADVKRRFQRMYQGYRSSIQIVVQEGVANGTFTPRVPEEHLSTLTLALFDGLFVQALLDPEAMPERIFNTLKLVVFELVMPGSPVPTLPADPASA